MAKTINSAFSQLDINEADIYVAPSKTMTLLIQVVNPGAAAVTCELWLTDASDAHVACILPNQSIGAGQGTSDTSKHIIPNGYKIRGQASLAGTIYVEISVVEGV